MLGLVVNWYVCEGSMVAWVSVFIYKSGQTICLPVQYQESLRFCIVAEQLSYLQLLYRQYQDLSVLRRYLD